MLSTGTSAEAKPSTSTVRRSLIVRPSLRSLPHKTGRSGGSGLGGVGVGVVLDEGGHGFTARLGAVLRDALLALRVAVRVAHRPVGEGDVRAVGERLAVVGGPRSGDELLLVVLALELLGDRLDHGELVVVLGDRLVVP